MYIFLSVFSVYHDTGDDKRPGKHLHNRIGLPDKLQFIFLFYVFRSVKG